MKITENKKIFLLAIICLLQFSCGPDTSQELDNRDTLFTELSSEETGVDFLNTVKNTPELNIFEYRNFYNGGGVGIADINNDGLSDIIFTANQGSNRIYLNKGDLKFEDITETAGISGINTWSTGIVMVDINYDGWLDIYICNAGIVSGDNQKNELYINNKDLTFTESAEAYNLAENGFTTHASFFDYDNDGDLDVYLLNNSFIPVNSLGYSNKRELRSKDWNVKEKLKGGGDRLLRNDNNVFTDVSEEAGIYGSLIGFGLGIVVGDINNDNWPDIYVCNDFYERDYLYINKKDGSFSEEIEQWAPHLSLSSMGADLSDINNDGHPDIFVTDMLVEDDQRLKETSEFEKYDLFLTKQNKDFHKQYMQNTLQLNNGNNTFSDIAYHAKVASTDWSWGALVLDMDNDSHKDIFVSNGIYHDLTNQDFMNFFADEIIDDMIKTGIKVGVDSIIKHMPSTPVSNYAFRNNGDYTFTNTVKKWGFSKPTFSNGTTYGDLDNDGDLDLVLNNVNQEALIYRNESNNQASNNYIQLKVIGSDKNQFAIGTILNLHIGNEIIHQQIQPSKGFQSSVDYIQTIGTGEHKEIDSIKIIWPNKKTQVIKEVLINQLITIEQNKDNTYSEDTKARGIQPFLQEMSIKSLRKQEENNYVDFDREKLIYKMLSKEGPAMAIGDLDNDSINDIFIGGPKGQAGQIYIQKDDNYELLESDAITKDAQYEDTAVAIFDANGDGQMDIMVGSGGNQVDGSKNAFGLRLYFNTGRGNYTKSNLDIPKNIYNTAIITPIDYDQDGDLDLFIGNRSIPGLYGMSPKHLLLENDGTGNYVNVISGKAKDISQIGMITDAVAKDMNNDGKQDLVVTEDWGHIHILMNDGTTLKKTTTNLNNLTGWWKTISAADVNSDGYIDLVIGNRGTNSIYAVDSVNVAKMFINDFDNSGSAEQIFTSSINGKDVPIHMKNEITAQLPILKKQNLKYSEYAKKDITDLFPNNKISRAITKIVTTGSSVMAINDGTNNFIIKDLPAEAQFSCINDIELLDINGDTHMDIIYAGNDYSLKPQFSQLDASYGGVLLGDGEGAFSYTNPRISGLSINGVVNSIKSVKSKKGINSLVFGINGGYPRVYSISNIDKQ